MSVMSELDKAQAGQLYRRLGEIGGIAPSDARRAMEGFCPSIAARLKEHSGDPDAYEALLALLDDNEDDLISGGDLADQDVLEDGRAVLAEIYGSEAQARDEAIATARALGIEPRAAEQLHLIAAALVLSILGRRYREQEGSQEDAQPSETASAKGGEGRPSILSIVLAAIGGAIVRALVRQLQPRRRRSTRARLGQTSSRRRRPRGRELRVEDLFRDLIR
jgi:hypothetical protein